MNTSGKAANIEVNSIVGARTRQGLVRIRLGAEEILMPPSKAREIAAFLLECAGSAEGDEALMRVMDRITFSPTKKSQILLAIRTERGVINRRAREAARHAIAEEQNDPDQATN